VAFPETARLAGSLYRRAAVCVLPSKNTSIIEVLRRPVESALGAAVSVEHDLLGELTAQGDRHL